MAKSKQKRVSITSFDKVMREVCDPIQVVEWNGIDVTIKPTLSFKDALTFVDSVAKSCFTTENRYLPEVRVFAIKCCVLEMYANFTLPVNVEHKYDLIYNTDAFDFVLKYINMKQFNEITDAISEKVDSIVKANIEAINQQMNEVYSELDSLQKQFENIFENLSSKDLARFVDAVTNSKLDEGKMINAYLESRKEEDGE